MGAASSAMVEVLPEPKACADAKGEEAETGVQIPAGPPLSIERVGATKCPQ